MFEYHGWICIVYAPYDVEDELERLDEVAKYAKHLIEQKLPTNYIAEFKPVNGEYMGSFAGLANHRGILANDLFDIFRDIGEKATGSYGLLYFWDDEDPEFDNEFRVGRLARGKFEILEDRYLSPRIPKLEDPC